MEGLVEAERAGTLGKRADIDHIILASPDIDIDLFRTQIAQLPEPILQKMYVLISKDDSALRVSRRLAGGVPRVGATDAAELEKLGVTVIDLSEIEDSSSGSHSKFAGSPEVVQFIGAGLNSAGRFGDSSTPRPRPDPERRADHHPRELIPTARWRNSSLQHRPAWSLAGTVGPAGFGRRRSRPRTPQPCRRHAFCVTCGRDTAANRGARARPGESRSRLHPLALRHSPPGDGPAEAVLRLGGPELAGRRSASSRREVQWRGNMNGRMEGPLV